MNQIVVYTLNANGNLGCFPECMVVNIDDKGQFSTGFVRINRKNKDNYNSLFDSADEKLLNCCFQLEKEVITSKTSDREARAWEDLLNKYFDGNTRKKKAANIEYIKNYLIDYINQYQDIFFENISTKQLYLPQGKFPFTWKKVSLEIEMPEMLYCFDNQPDWLYYSLQLSCRNKSLNLRNGFLVSRNRARVLVKSIIYEFDKDVDGMKLVPFFSKDFITVSQINTPEYIQKVVLPLVKTNRIISKGFDIQTITELSTAVLRVKEIGMVQQISLFEDETPKSDLQYIVLELIFEYQDFRFWAGQSGATNRLDMQDNSFTIYQVQRDKEMEQLCIDMLKNIGLDLDAKVCKMLYYEGVEWVNDNYKLIESTGVEIRFDKKGNEAKRIFMGERKITVELKEERDWFDIKGRVQFGEFEMPFLQVLNYIKHNKKVLLLPNGESVNIPQVWFDEYQSLVELCKIENGKATVAKHFCVVVDGLIKTDKITVTMKDNMRRLLENRIDADYDLPVHFNGQLRQYQQQGYNWLRLLDEMGLGGCLADDMGLGKTIQTLCLLQWLKEQNRDTNLLVVPTSLVYNWQQEIEKFTPNLNVYLHVGNQRTNNATDFGQFDILLTSYAILRRDKQLFENQKFNYIILDEAQAIKNPQSDITQVCLSLHANRFLTLTGTPIENSLTDLWSQVHFFNRNMLGSANHFTRACKQPEKQELYKRLIKPFLLRRHKNTVLTDLPEKTIIVQHCDMSEEQQHFYRDIRNSYRDKFLENKDENNKVNPIILLEGLLRMRQSANHPLLVDSEYSENSGKFDLVCQMLNDVISQGDKVLVFSSFVEHLKLYRNYLKDQKINYCYLDGSTKDRKEQVERFQQSDDYPIFLLSLKAGGVGLNLTRASYVFLLDPWWNPSAEAQAYDRAHRIGQQNKVFVYKFITQNSIEEKILQLQEQKLLLSESMFENESDTGILKQLDVNEVMKLIE